MEKANFKTMLELTQIDSKYHEKVLDYIDNHIKIENVDINSIYEKTNASSILSALYVISKIKNLDNVEFISSPNITDINIEVENVSIIKSIKMYKQDIDLKVIKDVEQKHFDELIHILNDGIDNKKIYIYKLFNQFEFDLNSSTNCIDFEYNHLFTIIKNGETTDDEKLSLEFNKIVSHLKYLSTIQNDVVKINELNINKNKIQNNIDDVLIFIYNIQPLITNVKQFEYEINWDYNKKIDNIKTYLDYLVDLMNDKKK